jgi:protein involved in polysaccharide export with SLBB domain
MSIRTFGKRLGSLSVACALVFGSICLSGCGTAPHEDQFAELPPGMTGVPTAGVATPMAPVAAPNPNGAPATTWVSTSAPNAGTTVKAEVFRPGDSLTVSFTDTPNPIQPLDQQIRADGTVTLILNKKFAAAGKTVSELEKEIRSVYVPDYYKYMTVTVTPVVSTRWYYVEGEVRSPNRQIYNSRLTVTMAIASAGGFTDFANKKKVKLVRVDGKSYTVNCSKALNNPNLDLEVYPGDKIHVPRRFW